MKQGDENHKMGERPGENSRGVTRREALRKVGYATAALTLGTAALGALAGCGGAAAPSVGGGAPAVAAPKKLRVWLFKSFVTDVNDILAQQVRDFAKQKNIEVEIDFSTFNDMFTKYAAAIEAGNPPDVGELDLVAPSRYHGMDQLLDVTDLANRVAKNAGGFISDERVMPMVRFDGRIWAVPRYSMLSMFFARKDVLAAKNLKVPDSWDEVVDVATKITDPAKEMWGFGQTINRSSDGDGFMDALLWSFGGSWTDTTGKKVALNSPESKAALQYAVEMFTKHKFQPPGGVSWTDANNNEAWLAGKIAMTNNGASIYYALVKDNHPLKDKTVVALTPKGPKGRFTEDNSYNFGIFKKTKHPDLCQELVEYVMHPDRFNAYMRKSVGQASPLYKTYAADPYWKTDPNFQACVDNGNYARLPGYPGPVTPAAAEVRAQHVLTDMASSVVTQKISIDQALETAHKRVERIYQTVR